MEQENKKSLFEVLSAINCNEHTETKNDNRDNITYLSWAWAWGEFRKVCPNATYEVYKDEHNNPFIKTGEGYMVFTKVTPGAPWKEETLEMWLPVMDSNNEAMLDHPREVKTKYKTFTVQAADMFDINKTIMRCLAKNVAMFGLGFYIYVGEDLPESEKEPKKDEKPKIDPNDPPTPHTIAVAKSLNIELDKVAKYYNKTVEFLTEGELNRAIKMKLDKKEGKKDE